MTPPALTAHFTKALTDPPTRDRLVKEIKSAETVLTTKLDLLKQLRGTLEGLT